ncbi:protein containing ChW-repeats and cell-adhesion domain [Lachnospiraceae bacterium KM106-2]|nr:protein containing ChW-repeats and cell-adhesion domain [Lachnospiraceae bacterium KM106-2]
MKKLRTTKQKLFAALVTISFIALLIGIRSYVNADSTTFKMYYTNSSGGGQTELSDFNVMQEKLHIFVNPQGAIDASKPFYINWKTGNSNIIKVEADATSGGSTNVYGAWLEAVSPGTTAIQAEIHYGTEVYIVGANFTVCVDINNDVSDTTFFKKIYTEDTDLDATLVLDKEDPAKSSKQLTLRYGEPNEETVGWNSANEDVVKVDANGKVTAVGAGITTISAFARKGSSMVDQSSFNDKIKVIVLPKYKAEDTGDFTAYGGNTEFESKKGKDITVYTNAAHANELIWVVKDADGNEIVNTKSGLTSDLVTLDPSDTTGTCIVKAKAGQYKIYSYVKNVLDSTYDTFDSTKLVLTDSTPRKPMIDPATGSMKVYVYFNIDKGGKQIISPSIGDKYDLKINTNVADIDNNFKVTITGTASVGSFTDNVMDFVRKGSIGIDIKQLPTSTLLLDEDAIADGTDIGVNYRVTFNVGSDLVIQAPQVITVGGTTRLYSQSVTTDKSIEYVSKDPSIATVGKYSGIVTGVKVGTTTVIGTYVTDDGVTKIATWEIEVVTSATIKIDPVELELYSDETEKLFAKYSVSNPSAMNIKWSTTDKDVVDIVESDKTYATIKAGKPGTASIVLTNIENGDQAFCKVKVVTKLESIKLKDNERSVELGDTDEQNRYVMEYTLTPSEDVNPTLEWESSNTNVATVDENGVVTVVGGGETIITVRDKDTKTFDTCRFIVKQYVKELSLSVTERTISKDDAFDVIAITTPKDYLSDNEEFTWTELDDNNTVDIKPTDNYATITGKSGGTTTIEVRTKKNLVARLKVTVIENPKSIEVESSDVSIEVGKTTPINVKFTPETATERTLKYMTSDSKIASVSDDGIIKGEKPGSAIITIIPVSGTPTFCRVTVTQPPKGIKLNYSSKTVTKGKTFTLKATISPSDATNHSVTYKSLNSKIATVSKGGVVKGIKGGSTVITATDAAGHVAYCSVTVKEKITSIKLNKTSLRIGVKKTYKLKATVKSNNASNQKLKWSTSNKKIAKVSSSGKVTGVKKGYATITVKATDGTNAKATCKVRIVTAVSSIKLNKYSVKLIEGQTTKLKATVNPKKATYKGVTWKSSKTSVATVDSKGKVTSHKPGVATITAKAKDDSGKTAKCIVTVIKAVPSTAITLPMTDMTLIVGETDKLEANVQPSNTTDKVKWYSSSSSTVQVNKSTGKIYAKRAGRCTVTGVTNSGKSVTVNINVVGLSRTKLTMEQYDTHTITVIGDAENVVWEVGNIQVARVTNGTVSARKKGVTTVTAIVDGCRLNCKVIVNDIQD